MMNKANRIQGCVLIFLAVILSIAGAGISNAQVSQRVWSTSTIDSGLGVGAYYSIAIDSNSKVHISYYDSMNGYLNYATNAFGWWETAAVDRAGSVGLL